MVFLVERCCVYFPVLEETHLNNSMLIMTKAETLTRISCDLSVDWDLYGMEGHLKIQINFCALRIRRNHTAN